MYFKPIASHSIIELIYKAYVFANEVETTEQFQIKGMQNVQHNDYIL